MKNNDRSGQDATTPNRKIGACALVIPWDWEADAEARQLFQRQNVVCRTSRGVHVLLDFSQRLGVPHPQLGVQFSVAAYPTRAWWGNICCTVLHPSYYDIYRLPNLV